MDSSEEEFDEVDEEELDLDDDIDIEEEEEIIEEKVDLEPTLEEEEEEDDDISEAPDFQYTVEIGIELGKLKKNVLIMLKDRGIQIDKEEDELISMKSLDVFCKCLQKKRNFFSSEYLLENKKTLLVHFIVHNDKKKVCLNEIKEIFKKKYSSYILIIPDKLSFDANAEIQKYKQVELFSYGFFYFPIAHHSFVPKHILLNEKEKEEFLKVRNISLDQLPILRIYDPIVKYYGWKKQAVVQIQRPGTNFYRVVT